VCRVFSGAAGAFAAAGKSPASGRHTTFIISDEAEALSYSSGDKVWTIYCYTGHHTRVETTSLPTGCGTLTSSHLLLKRVLETLIEI